MQYITRSEEETDKLRKFLKGELFSNYEEFKFVKKDYLYNRVNLIIELCKNKSVLHFGCCDHHNIIEQKISDQTHLHMKLSNATSYCLGVDIDREAIDLLKKNGIENCLYYDIERDVAAEFENYLFDYVLLGEILEHINNPVSFLSLIRSKIVNAEKIIVTVPYAFNSRNFFYIKRGMEQINTDHKYWFTPYTIAKVLTEAGYSIESIYYVDRSRIGFTDKIIKWFYMFFGKDAFIERKWPTYKSNGLMVIASFKNTE